jgi:rhodanese-related sulfurtransferase
MPEPARTLLEAALVAAVALGVGLCVNAVHPEGLSLTRDHFPAAAPQASMPANDEAPAADPARAAGRTAPVPDAVQAEPAVPEAEPAPAPGPAESAVLQRLHARGLRVLDLAEARAVFEDPAYAAGAYVFVDARGDDDYRAGHVPGAFQYDRFHPERHIDALLPACRAALQVVVYCLGGECEDSEFAALDLQHMGVDPQRIAVFAGGWTEWSAAGLPAETGARGGGDG